jgi:hypothetical protein
MYELKSSHRHQLSIQCNAKKYINPQVIRLSGFFVVQRSTTKYGNTRQFMQ